MSDQTVAVTKTPAQLEADRVQALQDLADWKKKAEALSILKDEEMTLRNKVVQYWFPKGLKEGSDNKVNLPWEGWVLQVEGKINRKIDEVNLPVIHEKLKKEFGVDSGELLKYKPELNLPEYRLLVKKAVDAVGDNKEHATKLLKTFDELLIISDGSPAVKINAPKKAKAKVSV